MAHDTHRIAVAGVSERDIDLLLLEEFYASEAFRRWFASHALNLEWETFVGARRSVTQSTGESDLEVSFLDADQRQWRLLIENKVSASFQRQQAARYQQRGNTYVEQGVCFAFRTILIAPERYFGKQENTKGFDARLTYEMLHDWFIQHDEIGARRFYKAALLTAAIEKATFGYQAEADAPVSNFWHSYWEMTEKYAPELQMKQPEAKPARAGFIYFRPASLPRGIEICHKLPHGVVDIQFRGMGERVQELRAAFQSHLHSDMSVKMAGKSSVVRLRVPVLNAGADFAAQAVHAQEGILAAKRLLIWYLDVQAT